MLSTSNSTQQGQNHSDETPQGPGHSRRSLSPVTISKAIGVCVVVAAALFALVSTGFGQTTPGPATPTTPIPAGQAKTVTVTVTAPTSESVIAADSVTVRGTVSPADATVQVQGQPAAVGNGVFTANATLHGGKTTIDVIGSAPGVTPGSTSIVIDRQSNGGRPSSVTVTPTIVVPSTPSSGGTSGETSCGNELSVGPNTTCPFAEDVRAAYDDSGPGTVMAYSPVTHLTYAMTCSDGAYVVCTGGNDASVYFPGQSSATGDEPQGRTYDVPPPATHAYSGETSCGNELSVGPDTTCAFAEDVRSAYEASGPGTVTAYSPVTKRTYEMTCTDDSTVVCTGGNNASVYFPS